MRVLARRAEDFAMSINSGNYKIAEEKPANISLRAVVGDYELIFGITFTVDPQREVAHSLTVHSGRINARTPAGQRDVGTARPSLPSTIQQHANPGYAALELFLPLAPSQLMALDEHHGGGDIDFDITLAGLNDAKHPSDAPQHQVVRGHIGQKAWIDQLAAVKAKDILILEVPMPIAGGSDRQKAAVGHLIQAQKLFLNGLYTESMSECHKALEEFESTKGAMNWQALGAKTDREALGKAERLRAIVGVVRHFTHPASHSASRSGIAEYSRADAKLMLTTLAAFMAHEASE
jgi:hypothetical protein